LVFRLAVGYICRAIPGDLAMKAVVIHAPHDLRVEDFDLPLADAPSPGNVRVRMEAGGICGSDLHYYHHGGFGVVRVKQPMALGHEASGVVEAVGHGVDLKPGTLVAVNPSSPCFNCAYCREGLRHHCTDMRFSGSAMRFPHEQGLFRACIEVPAERAVAMPAGTSPAVAALCEPFAVCLHAANQAGDLAGRTVLVSGCGPIGLLCIVTAKLRGAARILATDITQHCLDMASRMGATDCFDMSKGAEALAPFAEGKGSIDIAFECSGNQQAMATAISVVRPRGRVVLVGLGGDTPMPVNTIVAKELRICGTFRFDAEFNEAARLIGDKSVDLSPLVSAVYPMSDAKAAFDHAGDRTRATKVAIMLSA
jgi:L-idonate 5-dehydrogenase